MYIFLIAMVFCSYLISFAVNSVSLVLLCLFFFLDTKSNIILKVNTLKKTSIYKLFFILFICQLIGLLYTENLSFGIKKVIMQIPILFLPATILTEKINKNYFKKLLCYFKYWTVVLFLGLIIRHVYIDQRQLSTFVLHTITDRLGISQFYVVFILLIPIITALKSILNKKYILVNIILLCFFVFCMFLLGNKTSLLFLFFIISFFLYKQKTLIDSLLKRTIIVLSVVTLFICIYNIPWLKNRIDVLVRTIDFDIETIITKNSVTLTKNTLEHRVLINYIALKEFKNNFPFGVGTGDYQDLLDSNYKKINFKQGLNQRLNNHNQYVSEILKTGVLGGFVFFSIICLMIKSTDVNKQYYTILALSFAIGCIFESYLDRQHGVVIFAFLIPLFLNYENENKSI